MIKIDFLNKIRVQVQISNQVYSGFGYYSGEGIFYLAKIDANKFHILFSTPRSIVHAASDLQNPNFLLEYFGYSQKDFAIIF